MCSTQVSSIASQYQFHTDAGLLRDMRDPFLSIGYLSFIGNRNGSSGTSSSKYSQFLIAQLTCRFAMSMKPIVRAMNFAAQAMRLGEMRDFKRAGDAGLPETSARTMSTASNTMACATPHGPPRVVSVPRIGISSAAESFAYFSEFKIAKRFFKPVIIQFFQIAPDVNCFVEGIISDRIAHQNGNPAGGLAKRTMDFHVLAPRYRADGLCKPGKPRFL